ncbi:uncharacterized protein C8orf76 homolog isoform X2 [Antedon mediterranea]|uniref:uncharacterized protein C8orf76 homolog isoform X2 n=1 Tax=Antedon mediterranea TaxID=105859 RepID=UPI003AF7AB20
MDSLPFGFEEDDDLFESRSREKSIQNIIYTPKMCSFEWYMDQNHAVPEEKVELAKFVILSADQCFYKQQYAEAKKHYQRGLELSLQNSSLRRRFVDGLARCCCYLKDFQNAQTLAEQMVHDSNNDDQRSSALSLLLTVLREKRDLESEISTLENWIDIHPLNAHLWKKLSDAYRRNIKQIGTGDISQENEFQLKTVCSSLFISRFCLEIFQGGQSSFAKLKTTKMLKELKLDKLHLNAVTQLNIEEHCKELVFSIKTQPTDEPTDDGSVQVTQIETKQEKTGLRFQQHYFPWLF